MWIECKTCEGSGEIFSEVSMVSMRCPDCGGTGREGGREIVETLLEEELNENVGIIEYKYDKFD